MEQSKRRATPGSWKPGQSGNPKGRPRTGLALAETIRRMVDPEKLVTFALLRLEGAGFNEKDRQWAWTMLVDRGFIKPVQQVEVSTVDGELPELSALSRAELESIAVGELPDVEDEPEGA